ncbi:hypothetical protein GCM10010080_08000 [Thermomonas carbonis]|nr:hypothetical protein GCM10010080_08000 [Thermomonas carbonis]
MNAPALRIFYGGTFDPVHNGHVAIARAARDALQAEVALLPARDPPHKAVTGADADQRAAMLELAIADEPGLVVDRRELHRDGPSYSVDTLGELRGEIGQETPLAWLVGADSLRQLHTWHRWRDLLERAHLLVVQRPGADIDLPALRAAAREVAALVEQRQRPALELAESPHGGIAMLPLPGLRPESSTELRRRIANGEVWTDWVAPAVAGYIVRHGLYRDPAVILPAVAPPPLIEPAPLTTTAHVIKTSLPTPPPPVETLLKTVHDALAELKAKDSVEIDVRGKSSVCDYMVVASGTSTRHVKSVADEVVRFAKKLGVMPLGVEGEREAEWVLVDLGDVVVHVMLPRVREFYALERLWTVGDQHPDYIASDE